MSTPFPYSSDPFPPKPPHSLLGIASFVIALLSGCAVACFVGAAIVLDDDGSTLDTVFCALFFLFWMSEIVALAMGIAAIFQVGYDKTFAIMGVVISSLVFFGILIIAIIGLLS